MDLANDLEFMYEFQWRREKWRREKYTGQIQINVSKYPLIQIFQGTSRLSYFPDYILCSAFPQLSACQVNRVPPKHFEQTLYKMHPLLAAQILQLCKNLVKHNLLEERKGFSSHGNSVGSIVVDISQICSAQNITLQSCTTNHICAFFLYLDIAEKRKGKKRKLLIDPIKEISSKIMHKQLTSFTDTLMVLELAPPTQRLMMWKKKGGVDTLLSTAAQDLTHAELKMVTVCIFLCRYSVRL